jgi:N-methylhydantoinase B
MNNLSIGGKDTRREAAFAYYETIGGGAGAGPAHGGASGVHTHMTNTRNTPVEALEHAYPFRVEAYCIRRDSGGAGEHRGGDGIVRRFAFNETAEVTLLIERRRRSPYGLAGGEPGAAGADRLISSDGTSAPLPGKCTITVKPGQKLEISTPGGGGWGDAGAKGK